MAELDLAALVRLEGDTVPPLLQGLYGEIHQLPSQGPGGRVNCCVKVFTWNTECWIDLPTAQVVPQEPEVSARLTYMLKHDTCLPEWRAALGTLHDAWQRWIQIPFWFRDNLASDWEAPSLEYILTDMSLLPHQVDMARRRWNELLAAQRELAEVTREWLEG